jgi:hypothetical protein
MDLSGLTSVTTKSQLTAWLTVNLVTPVTPAISASDLGTIMQKMMDILGSTGSGLVLYDVHNGNYTLTLTDKAIDMNTAGANTLTIPQNANVAFPVGTQILITQAGAGQTTLAGDTGVTINSADGKLSLRTQYSWASLIKRATDIWWLSGDLGSTIVPVPKVVKINLTNTEVAATSPGWNNLNYDTIGTSLSLSTSAGDPSGQSVVASVGTANSADWEHITGLAFGNADFPDDVLDTLWYLNNGTSLSLVVSGLVVSQVYTVKTCAADNGTGDGQTKVTVGNSTQLGASPDNIAIELTFANVTSDGSGNLLIMFDNTAGAQYPLMNAIIISEN